MVALARVAAGAGVVLAAGWVVADAGRGVAAAEWVATDADFLVAAAWVAAEADFVVAVGAARFEIEVYLRLSEPPPLVPEECPAFLKWPPSSQTAASPESTKCIKKRHMKLCLRWS